MGCTGYLYPAGYLSLPGYVVPLWSYFEPGCRLSFRKAWFRALLPSQVLISYLFRIYVNNFANYANVYGSLVGIILLLFWLYLSARDYGYSVFASVCKNEAGEK